MCVLIKAVALLSREMDFIAMKDNNLPDEDYGTLLCCRIAAVLHFQDITSTTFLGGNFFPTNVAVYQQRAGSLILTDLTHQQATFSTTSGSVIAYRAPKKKKKITWYPYVILMTLISLI